MVLVCIYMATYPKCEDTQEDTIARVKAVAECGMTISSKSVGEFRGQVSPSRLTLMKTDGFMKLNDIGILIGTTKSLDEFCTDDFICDAVF
jgi:hypothetical protein